MRYVPNVHEPEDGLRGRQNKWTAEVDLEQMQRRQFVVVLTPISRVVILLAETSSLFAQNRRRIRLLDGDHHGQRGAGKDENDPVGPSPAEILENKAADDGAGDGAVHGGETEERHGAGQVVGMRNVDDGAWRIGNHDGTKQGTIQSVYVKGFSCGKLTQRIERQ